jgi:hypothetical protein
MTYNAAVDVGGPFTDVLAFDEVAGFDHGNRQSLEEQRGMIAESRRAFEAWLFGELGTERTNER